MTIAIAVAVPDGIALATDTQTTWTNSISQVQEAGSGRHVQLATPISIPVGWSRQARKLFSLRLGGKTFGLAVAGAALVNDKSPHSIFRSLESTYAGSGAYDDVARYLIDGLKQQLKQQFAVTELTKAPLGMSLTFILAGFEDGDISKPVLKVFGVFAGTPPGQDPLTVTNESDFWSNLNYPSRFNICWAGRGEFVEHVVSHANSKLPLLSGQYSLLTLSDAVDYLRFLAEFTCDFQRFAVMVPDCGRPVVTATLTPDGFAQT